jgi:DNA-directed RNA polymerase specialized sigma24 family protein
VTTPSTPPTREQIIDTARRVCTLEQLEAIELYESDERPGYRTIALRLGIGVTTVRDRIDRGMERVMVQIAKETESGDI